jgi:hypothetical protein
MTTATQSRCTNANTACLHLILSRAQRAPREGAVLFSFSAPSAPWQGALWARLSKTFAPHLTN